MDDATKDMLWSQFGASIDMLDNAMRACPDGLWYDRSRTPEFWYVAFHTLFYLDLYLSDTDVGFAPPPPFTLDEMDPAGIMPERPHTQEELFSYLAHGRSKCQRTITELTAAKAGQRCGFYWLDLSVGELLLYTMRHVQHHAGQLSMMLRQATDSAPRWVRKADRGLSEHGGSS
jgi:uncharacterized damage-inducible protein DinB